MERKGAGEMFTFRVHMVFSPEGCKEATSVLRSLAGPVRAEPGCRATRVLMDSDGQCGLTWIEEWAGVEDFERHLRTPAFRRILAVIEMAQDPPDVAIDNVNSRRGFDLVEELLRGGTDRGVRPKTDSSEEAK